MAPLREALNPEILEFCEREGALDALRVAIDLVQQYFPEARELRAELMWDPDDPDDEWISLTYKVQGSLDDIRARDKQMMDHWIAEVPWPPGDKVVLLPWPE